VESIFSECQSCFKQTRTWKKAHKLVDGVLSCMGRHTVTGWLTACGDQYRDWTYAYRLFRGDRMDIAGIFGVIRRKIVGWGDPAQRHVFAHMDDTLLRKTGKSVFGGRWMRDPLGPPFQTNLVWGQRFIQVSLSIFEKPGAVQARAIPIDFHHCPSVKKPGKAGVASDWEQYRETQKKAKLSVIGADRIRSLRENLDQDGYLDKQLVISVDGSYTNEAVLKKLPARTALIGRIRKDSSLYLAPESPARGKGRKKVYGESLPTPEQIRQSGDYPWVSVKAWAAGKVHDFDLKVISIVRWRKAGNRDLKLVIVRPVSYRKTAKSKLLYREPAYLICSDPEMDLTTLLQAYLWRWEIEVNFKDQKTILGCGQAQVRNKDACQKVPAFLTAVYSMLLIASTIAQKQELPRPKWYKSTKSIRTTTGDLINQFRAITWAHASKINFSDFVNIQKKLQTLKKSDNPTLAALFQARN
jgi:hypothetical protein